MTLPPRDSKFFLPESEPNDSGLPLPDVSREIRFDGGNWRHLLDDGITLAGKYRIARILGKGGFGVVYLARHVQRDKLCALKCTLPELFANSSARDLFKQECQIWIDLGAHPFIVSAEWVQEINGQVFVQMEYIPPDERNRTTMQHYLDEAEGPLGEGLIARWGVEFCLAMEHAAAHGMKCHRDIKPSNILIGVNGEAKASDFGIALSSSATGVRSLSGVAGTRGYIAPELLGGKAPDVQSDIYSFGVVLLQLVTGSRRPPEMSFQFASSDKRTPIHDWIGRCLSPEASRRYASFKSLRLDIEAAYPESAKASSQQTLESMTANSWSNKGASLQTLGRWPDAETCYRRALALDPNHAKAWNNLASAYLSMRNNSSALDAADRAIGIQPNYALAHLTRAKALHALGRSTEALESCVRAAKLDPASATMRSMKGSLMLFLRRTREAIADFDAALAIDANHHGARRGMGDAHLMLGNHQEAARHYYQACCANPFEPETWNNLGNCLGRTNRQQAAEAYHCATLADPAYAPAWSNLGSVRAAEGNTAEARDCFEKAIRLDPCRAGAWVNLGHLHFHEGRYQDAVQCYKAALAQDGQIAQAWKGMEAATEVLARGSGVSTRPPSLEASDE